jgi:hypothetical protein
MVAILVLLTIIACLTIDYLAERAALRRAARGGLTLAAPLAAPLTAGAEAPAVVGPDHAWLELGADAVPAALLGGIESVATVPAGTAVHQGDTVAELRHGDRAIALQSPVDGVVTAVNPAAGREPAGWLVRLAPTGLSAAQPA